jgi:hypothetical protein
MSYQPTMASYEGQSTQWSEAKWDPRGFYISERINAHGQVEYRYPELEQSSTPRTYPKSTYAESSDTPIEGTSTSPNYTPYGSSSTPYGNPTAVTKLPNQVAYTQKTSDASFGDEPSEEHDKFDLPTPTYPRSSPAPAAAFRDPNYSTGSMTDGVANLSLGLGRTTSSLSYGHEEEVVDDPYTNTVGKFIRRAPDSNEYEELDIRYRAIETKNLNKFWKVGRVFMMLWTEPARTGPLGGTRNGSHYSTIWLNEHVYSEIRRFVVISLNHGSTVCSPIHTYNKQATFKPNLPEVDQHAIIYTEKKAPQEMITSDANGNEISENLTIDPIRVIREQKDKEGDLGDYSRVNFSKIYTVENFVRVLNIGMVHPNSMDSLVRYARVKPRDTSPQPPRTHKKHSSSSHKDEKKSGNKEKGGKSKASDKKKS